MTTAMTYNAGLQMAEIKPAMFNRFIEFIDRTDKTATTYITNLKQFAAWMLYAGIDRPERKDIIAYKNYLTTEHEAIKLDNTSSTGWNYRTDNNGNRIVTTCKPNTTAQYLRSVCQFFKWTAAEQIYPDIATNIHAPKVRNDQHKKDCFTPAEVLTIENTITATAQAKQEQAAGATKDIAGRLERATEQGKRLYAMYLLTANAGLRTIELERATIKDIECKAGKAVIYIYGKGHTEADQKKPIAPEVYNAIQDYLNSRTDRPTKNSPLFTSTGNRSYGQRIAARTISQMLKDAMIQAGFDSERLTAHSLRHTAGTNVMSLTNNLFTTQHYMRHSNPATTEVYLHNDTEKQEAEVAQSLYNLYHNKETKDGRQHLEDILSRCTPEQLKQITTIAEAMTK